MKFSIKRGTLFLLLSVDGYFVIESCGKLFALLPVIHVNSCPHLPPETELRLKVLVVFHGTGRINSQILRDPSLSLYRTLSCSMKSMIIITVFSTLIGRELHNVATPALLCHKEPARRIQSPLLGAFERKDSTGLCLLLGSLCHKG